jgi:hypothetical protein
MEATVCPHCCKSMTEAVGRPIHGSVSRVGAVLDWLNDITAELVELTIAQSTRSGETVNANTRESFDFLAHQCMTLVAVHEAKDKVGDDSLGR